MIQIVFNQVLKTSVSFFLDKFVRGKEIGKHFAYKSKHENCFYVMKLNTKSEILFLSTELGVKQRQDFRVHTFYRKAAIRK